MMPCLLAVEVEVEVKVVLKDGHCEVPRARPEPQRSCGPVIVGNRWLSLKCRLEMAGGVDGKSYGNRRKITLGEQVNMTTMNLDQQGWVGAGEMIEPTLASKLELVRVTGHEPTISASVVDPSR